MRPARPASVRRDDRAEPDDVEPVERIDVVPPSASGGGNVLLHLKRELARLTQQAAAVERSIEQQSRERDETQEKLDRANERILVLESRLATAESDAHAKTEESSKVAALETQLADVRKRQYQDALKISDKESEIDDLRKQLERSARLDGELAELKLDHERLARELQDALGVVKDAESRAAAAERMYAVLAQSMLDLRDQISSGFARAGVGGPPVSAQSLPAAAPSMTPAPESSDD